MITKILPWSELIKIEKPGRYFGGERGSFSKIEKDEKGRLLKIALAFPDVYEIAHCHLGHKILYHLINQAKGLSAERVYAPWADMEKALRQKNSPLSSLESCTPLNQFHVLGFSLQYELGYTNILNMLNLAQIPLRAENRDESYPLITAGGPGAYNPEPLADFFDVFFIGDAEENFIESLEIIKNWRFENKAPKSELYKRLNGRAGIYIPSLFKPHYDKNNNFLNIENLTEVNLVKRSVSPDLRMADFPLCQITPFLKPVHDRITVEIARGCSRGCRFCQAGYIYRPVRERNKEDILKIAGANLKNTGQDELAFLSLSAGDHSQIDTLTAEFMDTYASKHIALSLPSLRVKSLKTNLAQEIKRVRKTGFTIAPEAGSQRLRNVINKNLTEEDLFEAAEIAFSLGWRSLKLYFMVGLPTETSEDIEAIGILAKKIKKMSRANINLGVAHFTPKAHTPFQWQEGSTHQQISERLNLLRETAKAPGLNPKWNFPAASWVESIIARGDRRVSHLLERAFQKGARFEAWDDCFQADYWREAIEELNFKEQDLLRAKDLNETLPYNHISAGVSQEFLKKELALSKDNITTSDCREDKCHNCGACQGEVKIKLASPVANSTQPTETSKAKTSKAETSKTETSEAKQIYSYLINFKKLHSMAFFSHLEMAEVFKRAFKRAGVQLKQSQGYHPQPQISFLTALPLGVISEDEYLKINLSKNLTEDYLLKALQQELPPDLPIKTISQIGANSKFTSLAITWFFVNNENVFQKNQEANLKQNLEYNNNKGRLKKFYLNNYILKAEIIDEKTAQITIKIEPEGTPKTLLTMAKIWNLDISQLEGQLYKLETHLK